MDISLHLLKNYSNYFNKKVRRKTSLNAYLGAVEDSFELASTDFNPNDGVATTHVVGSASSPFEPKWNPDYVIVVDKDDNNKIISRWFVTEFRRNMINQYTISLRRDVISDFYESCINSPCYIEKAHLDEEDPMIVNNEGISFNQIKTKEYYLKDESKVPWIICYLAQNERPWKNIKSTFNSGKIIETIPSEIKALFPDIKTVRTSQKTIHKVFDDYSFYLKWKYHFQEHILPSPIDYVRRGEVSCQVYPNGSISSLKRVEDTRNIDNNTVIKNIGIGFGYTDNGWDSTGKDGAEPLKNVINNINLHSSFNRFIANIYNSNGFTHHSTGYVEPSVKQYDDKIIKVSDTVYFKFKIERLEGKGYYLNDHSAYTELESLIYNSRYGSQWAKINPDNDRYIQCECTTKYNVIYRLEPVIVQECSMDLLGTKVEEGHTTASKMLMEPYDILCFPAFNTKMINPNGTEIDVNGDVGINMVRSIIEQLGKDFVYDAQIVPYCPVREFLNNGKVDLTKAIVSQYMPVTSGQDVVSYGVLAIKPIQHFEIGTLGLSIFDDEEELISSVLSVNDRKMESNTGLYRLSSPNYAASFDFNIAKCIPINRPELNVFKVDLLYRPYNPYIHIYPDFGFLYGSDFSDSRGLICSGDFSVTTITNAWTDYTVRNKNYQNIFDREIKNMETNRGFARERERDNIIFGAVGGGLGGAVAGAMGKIGTLPSAAIGLGIGIGKGIRTQQINEAQYQENVSFKMDMFNMQMDNIKALPDALSHTANLSNNFKFYPVLEYYTCTDVEKQALKDKIKYNGMTVGRIDTIKNYLSDDEERFVKGQMIRIEGIGEDSHIAMEIYNVINSGVFFTPEGE